MCGEEPKYLKILICTSYRVNFLSPQPMGWAEKIWARHQSSWHKPWVVVIGRHWWTMLSALTEMSGWWIWWTQKRMLWKSWWHKQLTVSKCWEDKLSVSHLWFFSSKLAQAQFPDLYHLKIYVLGCNIITINNQILLVFRSCKVQLFMIYCTRTVSLSMKIFSGIMFMVDLSKSLISISTVHL